MSIWFPLSRHLFILSRLILVRGSVVIFTPQRHSDLNYSEREGCRLKGTSVGVRCLAQGQLGSASEVKWHLSIQSQWTSLYLAAFFHVLISPVCMQLSVFLAYCAVLWNVSGLLFPLSLSLPIHHFLFTSLPVCLHIPVVLYTLFCPCTCLSDLAPYWSLLHLTCLCASLTRYSWCLFVSVCLTIRSCRV